MLGENDMKNSVITPLLRPLKRSSGLRATLLSGCVSDPEDLWGGLLSSRERLEGRNRSSPAARRNWFMGRLAAKAAAADLLDLSLSEVEILRGPDGRPQLEAPGSDSARTQISISHTEGGALAAAAYGPVGVDLESLDRIISDRVWLWAFRPEERALSEGAEPDFSKRLAMWCAKEAAAKCWGLALLNHLSEFQVSGEEGWGGDQNSSSARLLFVEDYGIGREPRTAAVEILEDGHFIAVLALPASGQSGESSRLRMESKAK